MDTTTITTVDPQQAYDHSYFTIIGAGGDLTEWVTGVEGLLAEEGIGKPTAWYTTTGAAVNDFAQPEQERDALQPDLTFLLFPLDGLHAGRLAMFRLRFDAKWFDDMIENMR